MVYLNIICWGDSQTSGARTYGCYPLYLANKLTERTGYNVRAINKSVNGYTARQLWFKMNEEIESVTDTEQSCVMIGTNDCRLTDLTDEELFRMYYEQMILTLKIKQIKNIFIATIPPIYPSGYFPYGNKSNIHRKKLNKIIRSIAHKENVNLVDMGNLNEKHYVDAVHLNEDGNKQVAFNFIDAFLKI